LNMTTPIKNPQKKSAVQRDIGEPQVWLTALGLSVGLLMVIALLFVIISNGMQVFWPKRLVTLTVQEQGKTYQVTGEIVVEREKHLVIDGQPAREIQLFTGNKDAYGQAFRFIDVTSITQKEQLTGLVKIERLEYGNAIGKPTAIILPNRTIPSDNQEFLPTLNKLLHESTERRETIHSLEDSEIGANARQVTDLGFARRTAERKNDQDAIARIDAELKQYQEKYEVLSSRARELRKLQDENHLTISLSTGEERKISFGSMVKITWSNDLNLFARLWVTLENLWAFMVENPREANTEGGIFPAIFGTFVMTILMSVAVTPFGVVAAIYLREYAKQGVLVRTVRIAVNNLAGVPSIVFGIFGLGFFVYLVGGTIDSLLFEDKLPTPTFGTGGILWASLTLALMTVPVVIVATEEAIAAVPRGAKEGSLALGASKWQTIQRIVLPAAIPGILTGLILAMARGAGEVAPLMLVGVVKLAPSLPIDGVYPFLHLDQKFMHLGFHIYDLGFQSPDSEAAKPMVYATTFFLIALVLVLNLSAILIRERLRRRFATAAF
jgi:phosphate transport system permease protein